MSRTQNLCGGKRGNICVGNNVSSFARAFKNGSIDYFKMLTGFVRVLKNLESPGILLWHFPGLESPGKRPLVLESSGNLLNSAKKYEVYGRHLISEKGYEPCVNHICLIMLTILFIGYVSIDTLELI